MEDEEASEINIEWKKNKGIGTAEKLTRKTDVKQALHYEATAKKPLTQSFAPRPSELPKGLKKIRKKIKEAYDDDEDEDDVFYDAAPHELDNSLMEALYENEKKQLKQKETLNIQKMQQTAGRMEAVLQADKMAREAGLKGLQAKTVQTNSQDVTLINSSLEKVLSEDIARRTKTGVKRLSKAESITMLRGIDRIRKMALAAKESQLKALENMKVEDVLNAGNKTTDDQEVAELILKKSGRKSRKETINKIVQKSKQQEKSSQKQNLAAAVKDKSASKKPTVDKYRNLSARDI